MNRTNLRYTRAFVCVVGMYVCMCHAEAIDRNCWHIHYNCNQSKCSTFYRTNERDRLGPVQLHSYRLGYKMQLKCIMVCFMRSGWIKTSFECIDFEYLPKYLRLDAISVEVEMSVHMMIQHVAHIILARNKNRLKVVKTPFSLETPSYSNANGTYQSQYLHVDNNVHKLSRCMIITYVPECITHTHAYTQIPSAR